MSEEKWESLQVIQCQNQRIAKRDLTSLFMIYLCRTSAETVGEWLMWRLRIVDDEVPRCWLQRTNKDLKKIGFNLMKTDSYLSNGHLFLNVRPSVLNQTSIV